MAAAEEDVRDPVAALPPTLVLRVFALLPLDVRLRCAEVSPGWCKALADRSLWADLDLTQLSSGVACTTALLCAATKRAAGSLQTLRLPDFEVQHVTLCGIAAANAATLRELRFVQGDEQHHCEHLEELLRFAPQLRLLGAAVHCMSAADAQRVLRREPPFGALSVRRLEVGFSNTVRDADSVLALAADLAASTYSMPGLVLYLAPLNVQAALETVVDAALLAGGLSHVQFDRCSLSPVSAPALAHLLRGGALTHFGVDGNRRHLLDEPAAALLGAAVSASTTLTSLSFVNLQLWDDPVAAAALLDAITAHPSLRTLDLVDNSIGGSADLQVAAGSAFNMSAK
jgi:hypothetical protein